MAMSPPISDILSLSSVQVLSPVPVLPTAHWPPFYSGCLQSTAVTTPVSTFSQWSSPQSGPS